MSSAWSTRTARCATPTATHGRRGGPRRAQGHQEGTGAAAPCAPGLPEATYRSENDALRDIARSLTAAREADVLTETFELVAARLVGRVPELELDALRVRVAELADALRPAEADGARHDPRGGRQRARRRRRARPRARSRSLRHRARSSPAASAPTPAASRRSRSPMTTRPPSTSTSGASGPKTCGTTSASCATPGPSVFKAQADAADRLTKLLGDDHDLAQLAEHLPERARGPGRHHRAARRAPGRGLAARPPTLRREAQGFRPAAGTLPRLNLPIGSRASHGELLTTRTPRTRAPSSVDGWACLT